MTMTLTDGSSESRFATTSPPVPAPTMTVQVLESALFPLGVTESTKSVSGGARLEEFSQDRQLLRGRSESNITNCSRRTLQRPNPELGSAKVVKEVEETSLL